MINALQERFPLLGRCQDICYATQNRQSAVRDLVKNVDLVLVVGAKQFYKIGKDIGSESGVNT